MGCGMSTEDPERKRNDVIETQLKKDYASQRNQIKMLLLGTGESGKSTILKQMRLIHDDGYDRRERESFKDAVFYNTVQSMQAILEAIKTLGLELGDLEAKRHAETIMAQPKIIEADSLPADVGRAITFLWKNDTVQLCFKRSNEFQLNDSAKYFFDSAPRISESGYIPTDQDILHARVQTTGIVEVKFAINNLTYQVCDVGGQRSERRKWIHCFENVTAIIFLVAISEYNQCLLEDSEMNRMDEALNLFDSICNSQWFTTTSIILFMNKTDLFKQKLLVSPLKNHFPDYEGGPDYTAACDFLLNRFVSLNRQELKKIYSHFTCATDTTQTSFALDAVNDIVCQEALRNCGIL